MSNDTRPRAERMWHDSAHVSLCALGAHLQQLAFFHPLEERVRIKQQALKDTPGQQVLMVFVSLLAGAKAVCHADTTVRLAPALQRAFGLPGGAEQSVLADTLNAATERDVADLRAAVDALFRQHSRARRHDCAREPLVLDVDLSPLPASARAAGAERAYLGRCRSETGRTLVRVRAAPYQETVWEAGRAHGRAPAGRASSRRAGGTPAGTGGRRRGGARQAGAGGDPPGQELGEHRGDRRALGARRSGDDEVQGAQPGQEAGARHRGGAGAGRPGAAHAAVRRADARGRAAGGVPLRRARHQPRGPGAAGERGPRRPASGDGSGPEERQERKLAAQQVVVLLGQLAPNVLLWSRRWLAAAAPRLAGLGLVRLVRAVWAVPGRVKLTAGRVRRVRLRAEHPRARDVCRGLRGLLPPDQTPPLWGYILATGDRAPTPAVPVAGPASGAEATPGAPASSPVDCSTCCTSSAVSVSTPSAAWSGSCSRSSGVGPARVDRPMLRRPRRPSGN